MPISRLDLVARALRGMISSPREPTEKDFYEAYPEHAEWNVPTEYPKEPEHPGKAAAQAQAQEVPEMADIIKRLAKNPGDWDKKIIKLLGGTSAFVGGPEEPVAKEPETKDDPLGWMDTPGERARIKALGGEGTPATPEKLPPGTEGAPVNLKTLLPLLGIGGLMAALSSRGGKKPAGRTARAGSLERGPATRTPSTGQRIGEGLKNVSQMLMLQQQLKAKEQEAEAGARQQRTKAAMEMLKEFGPQAFQMAPNLFKGTDLEDMQMQGIQQPGIDLAAIQKLSNAVANESMSPEVANALAGGAFFQAPTEEGNAAQFIPTLRMMRESGADADELYKLYQNIGGRPNDALLNTLRQIRPDANPDPEVKALSSDINDALRAANFSDMTGDKAGRDFYMSIAKDAMGRLAKRKGYTGPPTDISGPSDVVKNLKESFPDETRKEIERRIRGAGGNPKTGEFKSVLDDLFGK